MTLTNPYLKSTENALEEQGYKVSYLVDIDLGNVAYITSENLEEDFLIFKMRDGSEVVALNSVENRKILKKSINSRQWAEVFNFAFSEIDLNSSVNRIGKTEWYCINLDGVIVRKLKDTLSIGFPCQDIPFLTLDVDATTNNRANLLSKGGRILTTGEGFIVQRHELTFWEKVVLFFSGGDVQENMMFFPNGRAYEHFLWLTSK